MPTLYCCPHQVLKATGAPDATLPKGPINQLKPFQQSRKQTLRSQCPIVYTVALGLLLLVHDQCIEPFKTGYFKNDQSVAYPYKVQDFVYLFVCLLCTSFVCHIVCLFVALYLDVEKGCPCPCITGIL
jgi:hypothetical protein